MDRYQISESLNANTSEEMLSIDHATYETLYDKELQSKEFKKILVEIGWWATNMQFSNSTMS